MEQKYICVSDGQLVFDCGTHRTLNEHNIDEANAELAEMACNCRREAEVRIGKNINQNLFYSYSYIALGVIVIIPSIVVTIFLDWGFFGLIVLGGIALAIGVGVLINSIRQQKACLQLLKSEQLYFAQIVKAPKPLFIAKLQCACVIDGQPRVLTCRINWETYYELQKKTYIIIAYDKATESFLPIRLFVDDGTIDN